MDLSIIIPCHNLEKFISPLISTLEAQRFDQYTVELIFVLDDCNDDTARILMNHEFGNYEQVRLINTCVRSCGLARNIGLDHAQGEYIWFVDGDDWLLSTTVIQEVLDVIKSQKQNIIKIDYEAPNFDFYGYPSMVWQYIMRRDFIGDLKFTEIQPNEDVKFMGSLLCDLQDPIYFLNKKLYYYNYMREGSNMYQFRTTGKIEP